MQQKTNKLIAPILKWVGGKRQLLNQIEKHIPNNISRYYEPFVGGAALLFYLQPKRAIINDKNAELINVYNVIKDFPNELIQDLQKHKNEADYFYQIRRLDRESQKYDKLNNIERASRIIFLNKTCYNGLFRVNSSGEFNTPFGRYKNPNIVNELTIRAVSDYLKINDIKITHGDYENVLLNIREDAFVYIDPPYDPVSNSANFTDYTKIGFDREQQQRLKVVCDNLNQKGIKFLLSNSSTDFIKELYKNYSIHLIKAKRVVNSKPTGRGEVEELLIKNYE